jgi:hypothetical protein
MRDKSAEGLVPEWNDEVDHLFDDFVERFVHLGVQIVDVRDNSVEY